MTGTDTDKIAKYREIVRRTMQMMSDEALAFQDSMISRNDCVDRQEIDRELSRRMSGWPQRVNPA